MSRFYYHVTPEVILLIVAISEKIGAINAHHLNQQSPQVKRQNKIKIIHSSLVQDGYKIKEEDVARLLEQQKAFGNTENENEILNRVNLYEHIKEYVPFSETSFMEACQRLTHASHVEYRTHPVRSDTFLQSKQIPAKQVPELMRSLFHYLENSPDLLLLKSCFFYYQMEMIRPFEKGNKSLARFWQKLIMAKEYPVFEYMTYHFSFDELSPESKNHTSGDATPYMLCMLEVINRSLEELLHFKHRILTDLDRIFYFLELGIKDFNRRDYMITFKEISPATASRDLKKALQLGCITKYGDKNQTRYKIR